MVLYQTDSRYVPSSFRAEGRRCQQVTLVLNNHHIVCLTGFHRFQMWRDNVPSLTTSQCVHLPL